MCYTSESFWLAAVSGLVLVMARFGVLICDLILWAVAASPWMLCRCTGEAVMVDCRVWLQHTHSPYIMHQQWRIVIWTSIPTSSINYSFFDHGNMGIEPMLQTQFSPEGPKPEVLLLVRSPGSACVYKCTGKSWRPFREN